MEVLWFFIGLVVGLALDFVLVLHMLKPLKKRILKLENRRYVKAQNRDFKFGEKIEKVN